MPCGCYGETMPPDHDTDDELDGPMLFGRVLDGKGGGRAISWADAQAWQPTVPGEVLWVHLCRDREGVSEWLAHLAISRPTIDLLTSATTRPRALAENDSLVATLRGINLNPGADLHDMVSMQMWSDGRRLISLRRLRLQTPRDTLADLDAGHGPVDAGSLVTSLVGKLISRINQAVIGINEQIDALDDADPDGDTQEMLERISTIRRNCLALKRHMAPQHEAIEAIARSAPSWFEQHDRRELAETIDRLRRYLDDIDISKESALVLQDDLRARSLASSEHATYMLTIVAGIFLPLSFLTGLLGINVGGMPGADHDMAFWIVVSLCGAIMAMQLFLFWRWKWF